ncbi:COR domain-containing protein, partial [Chloroflexota bacterium]
MSTTPQWAHELIQKCIANNEKQLTLVGIGKDSLKQVPPEVFNLTQLTSLHLSDNDLTQLPKRFRQLINLTTLDLRRNNLAALPDELQVLTQLTSLDLSYNNLTQVPLWLKHLTNLSKLYLSNNNLTQFPAWLANLPNLKNLYIYGNPIKDIPPEYWSHHFTSVDLHKIRTYYLQLKDEGEDHLYETKLLIIGEGGAGKTTLTRKLLDPRYKLKPQEISTEGIDVFEWHFTHSSRDYRVNIWDFGGQEIYHATHQFFLTKRSLYVLVADSRKEDTDFNYWLHVQELLAGDSPLLLIKNEKQDRTRELDEKGLHQRFPNFKHSLPVNLASNRGLKALTAEIQNYVLNLPHIGTPLPKTWVTVRRALDEHPANYISLDDYLNICQEKGYDRSKALNLSGFLHDLGVCLHFQDEPVLKKMVILKPEWGTAAAYKVLDDPGVIERKGRFNLQHIEEIWHEPQYDGMHHELLQLMRKFKICYQLQNKSEFIAPQLLTLNQPDYNWEAENNLVNRYSYDFMPKGILTQFIVALNDLITDQNLVWRTGVVLSPKGARAEVIESYDGRQIDFRLSGPRRAELLDIVANEFEKIHRSYHNLKQTKWVSCICQTCQTGNQPHLYQEHILHQFVQDG